MPRNLPWKTPSTQTRLIDSPQPTKRRKPSPSHKYSDLGSAAYHLRQGRSPSTSPPPPPPDEVFMRTGLSADDAYIMVEDEFLSTARLFTAHLHHAEYKRLKTLARSRKAVVSSSPLADLAGATAAHRRSKAVEAQRARNAANLDRLGLAGRDSDASDAPSELDPDDSGPDVPTKSPPPEADDPWLGTSLAPLLSPGTRRAERHLMAPPLLTALGRKGASGLDPRGTARGAGTGRSDTRAARGYSAAPTAAALPRRRRDPQLPLPPGRNQEPPIPPMRDETSVTESEDDDDDADDDDNLDAPAHAPASRREERSETVPKYERERSRTGLPSPPPRRIMPLRKDRHQEIEKEVDRKWAGTRSASDSISDSAMPGRYGAGKTRVVARPWLAASNGAGKGKGQAKEVDVNEIPTFLV